MKWFLFIVLACGAVLAAAQGSGTITVRKPVSEVPRLLMGKWTFEASDHRELPVDTPKVIRHEFTFRKNSTLREWAVTRSSIIDGTRTWNLAQANTTLVLLNRNARPGWSGLLPNGGYRIERLNESELWLRSTAENGGLFRYSRVAVSFD